MEESHADSTSKKETATATRKVATKVETKTTVEEPVIAEKPIEEKIEKEKKVFTDSDYILCRSVCYGGLNITSQSGNVYEFKDYGYDCEINYRDLVSLIRKGSDHVFLPRFVILDDDLLEDFPTVKKYMRKCIQEMICSKFLICLQDRWKWKSKSCQKLQEPFWNR